MNEADTSFCPLGTGGQADLNSNWSFKFCFQEKIEAINQAVANEYEVRRKLLIKRLDVTVQSFGWSDRAKVHTK